MHRCFKRSKYPDVILPLTVLRRLDCVLEPTRERVQTTYARFKDKLENLAPQLRKASGFAFCNTSPYNFERLLGDPEGEPALHRSERPQPHRDGAVIGGSVVKGRETMIARR